MSDQKHKLSQLATSIREKLGEHITSLTSINDELTIEVNPESIRIVANTLLQEEFAFQQLIDLCGVDYLHFGLNEWETDETTTTGFSRGVITDPPAEYDLAWTKPRFAVVYHLLSITHNWRLRVRALLANDPPRIDSVNDIWPNANWYEREAFDLFGILFNGHPDLRRILTDYGFIGYPMRKDFPTSGTVEVRYDPEVGRVIYLPVTIEPRVLVPRVIRHDHRYVRTEE